MQLYRLISGHPNWHISLSRYKESFQEQITFKRDVFILLKLATLQEVLVLSIEYLLIDMSGGSSSVDL